MTGKIPPARRNHLCIPAVETQSECSAPELALITGISESGAKRRQPGGLFLGWVGSASLLTIGELLSGARVRVIGTKRMLQLLGGGNEGGMRFGGPVLGGKRLPQSHICVAGTVGKSTRFGRLLDQTEGASRVRRSSVGLAESPATGESFGEHRCGLLADGIVDAHERGVAPGAARVEAVITSLAGNGVEIDAPYLEPSLDELHVL